MKKAEWKIGELVQVPYYCFAPHRKGWNGYLFANGVIVERHRRVKDNAPIAVVEYRLEGKAPERHKYTMDKVFKAPDNWKPVISAAGIPIWDDISMIDFSK